MTAPTDAEVETVARAMCEANGQDPDRAVAGSAGVSTAGIVYSAVYRRAWQDQAEAARAAIICLDELRRGEG